MANPQNQQPSHQAALLQITVFVTEGWNHPTYLGSCHCGVATSVGIRCGRTGYCVDLGSSKRQSSAWGLSTSTHVPTKGSVISLAFTFTYEEGNKDQVIYSCRLFNNRVGI